MSASHLPSPLRVRTYKTTRMIRRGRRGMAVLYLAVMLMALLGFASLAVDWGRVQMVKTQLQRAADAASRAAASQLSNGVTATQNAAVTWGGYNTADGMSVVIDPNNDVEFGTWDSNAHTFTVLSGAARTGANSVRVTARRTAANGNGVKLWFASLIGQNTIDVKAPATALRTGGPLVVGLALFNPNGNPIDSFDSSLGAYTTFPKNSKAVCVSNAAVDCHNSIIKGDCHPGVGQTITNNSNVSGSSAALTTALSYATPVAGSAATTNNNASLPGAYFNSGTRDFAPTGSVTIPGGTYYVNNMNWNNSTINFTGPVIFYVTGAITQKNDYVTTYQNRPKNLQILVTTSQSVQIDCDQILYAIINAPLSAVSIVGQADTCGSVIANSLTLTRTAFHADESLSDAATTVK